MAGRKIVGGLLILHPASILRAPKNEWDKTGIVQAIWRVLPIFRSSLAPGLNRLTLTNGGRMNHHAMLFRFNPGKTVADLAAAFKQDSAALTVAGVALGGPGGVNPGMTSSAVLDLLAEDHAMVLHHRGRRPRAALGQGDGAADLHMQRFPLAPGFSFDQSKAILLGEAAPTSSLGASPAADTATPAAHGGTPFAGLDGMAPIGPGRHIWSELNLPTYGYAAA